MALALEVEMQDKVVLEKVKVVKEEEALEILEMDIALVLEVTMVNKEVLHLEKEKVAKEENQME